MFKRSLATIVFNFTWLFLKPIFHFFLHLKIESEEEDLKKIKSPMLIIINHTCWIDPFLVGSVFPFLSKVFPISYAAWYRHYYSVLLPSLFLYGCFPVQRGLGLEKTLKEGIKVLNNRGTVGIFPEGRRRHLGRPRRGRRGAAYLAVQTGVPILPVKIEGILGIKLLDFLLRRRKAVIKVGKLFYLSENEKDLDQATEIITKKLR